MTPTESLMRARSYSKYYQDPLLGSNPASVGLRADTAERKSVLTHVVQVPLPDSLIITKCLIFEK